MLRPNFDTLPSNKSELRQLLRELVAAYNGEVVVCKASKYRGGLGEEGVSLIHAS